jgi:hypothetical protein
LTDFEVSLPGPLGMSPNNSIQDDFQRIIIITYIDELKDAFPVRIEVTEKGSTIAVT